MKLKKIWAQPGGIALTVAAVLLVLTAGAAFWPVANHNGTACGSWIAANDSASRNADRDSQNKVDAILSEYGSSFGGLMGGQNTSEQRGCSDARSTRTIPVAALGVLTVLGLVVGVMQRYRPRSPQVSAAG